MHSHIALRNIWLGFVALPWRSASAIDACASFSRFTSAFEAMQYTRDTSTASVSPFRGNIFFVLDCASCPSSSSVLARYHLFRCVAFGANAQIGGSSLFPFFDSSLCVGFYPMCWSSLSSHWFRSGGSLGFIHCVGFRHQRSFRPVSAFSFYHGLRLSAPSVAWLSALSVACLSALSVAWLSALFFSAASFHPRLQTVAVSINQVRSQIQLNPQALAFKGFRWILIRSRGNIFRVRVPYFVFMALSLIFQKS